ncbi:MAG: metallopeptidase family protein [Corynebacterium glutamicum]|nr:metallopeptidase family protein [Corynebacterium glutamicum]
MHTRTFRNRHGRGLRGPLMPVEVPRHASRRQAFDRAVLEAYSPLYGIYQKELSNLDIAVDTVPRMRLSADLAILPDEITADGPVPLGRVIPPAIDTKGNPARARIVIFRMPIEQRVTNAVERHELLTHVLTSLVANYLNIDPRDIDPGFQDL